ncbi:hypothetical protein EIH01_16785, partial [Staphylococcus aureus]
MQEEKQKEVALTDDSQEWKTVEQKLNIKPITVPEKGVNRYEKARAHKQSLERDIGLRNERLAQLKEEATQLDPVK